jgi:hypothetical protein
MKRLFSLLVTLSISGSLFAAEQVTVPWAEFKDLYKESIEREVMRAKAEPASKKEPLVYSIEDATYRLKLSKDSIEGEVRIVGRIISGDPAPIPLFGRDIVIAKMKQVEAGSLLSGQGETGGISFLPNGKEDEFQVTLSFLVGPQEDSSSRFISFAIPSALKNSLVIELPESSTLLQEPGIVDADGVYHFAASTSLDLRFRDEDGVAAVGLVDIDTFSRVRLQGKRAMITTSFSPVRTLPRSFVLQVQDNAQYVSSSLKSSWLRKREDNSYEIKVPQGNPDLFWIQFAIEESVEEKGFAFRLPLIKENNGKEGDFVLEEPDDGQVTLVGKGLVSGIPAAKLNSRLLRAAGKDRFYMHIPSMGPIRLDVERFKAVSTPPIVLDSQYFFTSFEENGNVLSIIELTVPAGVGPRLKLNAVPGSEIWSLSVNDRKRKVYTNDDGKWIIPLADGEASKVQLALLRKEKKLGLHGRLEVVLPETGLPSRSVRVGIALPERVQLLSFEGPLNPAKGESWKRPSEFIGKPHFFSGSFYKGQGMKMAVSYKEPVK